PAENVADNRLDARREGWSARDDAGARQREMLPSPGFVLLIALERADHRGHRTGTPGGAQPHVDMIERTVVRLCGQRADEALRHAREILSAVERPLSVGLRMVLVEIIDDDEIEIGGGGHLAAAELAER